VPHAASGETISPGALRHTLIPPVGAHEIAGLGPLMFLIVVIGVYPRPVLEQMKPTLAKIKQISQEPRVGESLNRIAKPVASGARTLHAVQAMNSGDRYVEQKNPTTSHDNSASPTREQEKHL
jgi:hypothetical protein